MKLSGARRVELVEPNNDGSSVRTRPPRWTGAFPELNSSTQSGPLAGFAIHSFSRKLEIEPRASAVEFAAPGVGETASCHEPSMSAMDLSTSWNPYTTESTN